jgi:TATA-box binding protein (TBP) (component of TFIID and TFIIIB)
MAAPDIANLEYISPTLNFSTLRISTITTTAQLGTKINLESLFTQIPIMEYWDLNDGILKMEFNGSVKGTSFKDIILKPKTTKTSFFNQATLVIRKEVNPLCWKEINVKLFRNGGVQMTGVRSIEMSSDSLHWLIEFLKTHCTEQPVFTSNPEIHKEQIQLVNTDFSIGAKVKRDILHRILSDKYRLNSSYESAIYQGVKTKYFYNAQRPANSPPGLCPCPRLCKGTGDGSKIGECKKITISPFQTGQVIITGGRTMEQINEAYEFIKGVFTTHANDILRKMYVLPTAEPSADTTTKTSTKKKRESSGWIQHPCPRNIFKMKTESHTPVSSCV